jgi:hypothetical protein
MNLFSQIGARYSNQREAPKAQKFGSEDLPVFNQVAEDC